MLSCEAARLCHIIFHYIMDLDRIIIHRAPKYHRRRRKVWRLESSDRNWALCHNTITVPYVFMWIEIIKDTHSSTGKSPDPRLNPLLYPNPLQNVLIIICRVEDQLKERLRGSFRGVNLIIYLFKTNCLGFNSLEHGIPKGFWEERDKGPFSKGDTLSLLVREWKMSKIK